MLRNNAFEVAKKADLKPGTKEIIMELLEEELMQEDSDKQRSPTL